MKNFLRAAFAAGIFTMFCATCQATLVSSLNLGPYSYTNITCTSQVASDCAAISSSGTYMPGDITTAGTAIIFFADNGRQTPGDTITISYDLTYYVAGATYPGLGFYQGLLPLENLAFEGGWISSVSGGVIGSPLELSPFYLYEVGSGPSLQYEYSITLLPYSPAYGDGTLALMDAAIVNSPEPSYTSLFAVVGLLVTVQQVRRSSRVQRDGC